MEITGKLIVKKDTITLGESFNKREFVVEYAENPTYPEFVQFELIQDKCGLLDSYDIGQEMKVNFNLKGRKWVNPKQEEVYFNSLQAWKIEKSGSTPPQPTTKEPQWMEAPSCTTDDMPF